MAALAIRRVMVSAYKIPMNSPEADGTLAWDSTTAAYPAGFPASSAGRAPATDHHLRPSG